MTVKSMLASLFQLGLSQAEIAEICESTQPTISRAANGAMVRYELGKAIEAIFLKEMSLREAEPPQGCVAEELIIRPFQGDM